MSHNGSSETSSFVDENWTSWFCGLSGNQFFCEVEKSYIEDSFNLFGLKQYLSKDYTKALDTILDRLTPMEPESEELSRSAALLYGLIHARYIITSHGLEAMHRKFLNREFGDCPRAFCRGQPVVPLGFTDEPKHSIVKVFCPRCREVYNCQPSQRHIDGAFFGPTFPHIFFMTFDDTVPEPTAETYVPRVFGFRIHSSSSSIPKALPATSARAVGLVEGGRTLPPGHGARGGLGGLSEASTGAGTGYEKSGGGESRRGGRLLAGGLQGGAARSSAASGGATGEDADDGGAPAPAPRLANGGGWGASARARARDHDSRGDKECGGTSSSNVEGLGLVPGKASAASSSLMLIDYHMLDDGALALPRNHGREDLNSALGSGGGGHGGPVGSRGEDDLGPALLGSSRPGRGGHAAVDLNNDDDEDGETETLPLTETALRTATNAASQHSHSHLHPHSALGKRRARPGGADDHAQSLGRDRERHASRIAGSGV